MRSCGILSVASEDGLRKEPIIAPGLATEKFLLNLTQINCEEVREFYTAEVK